jgi:CYTH domain-containing protein
MEIERKFLIKDGLKEFWSPFPVQSLKKEIKDKGKLIVQSYLPVELIIDVLKTLDLSLNFKADELRIRKIKKKYSVGFKSSGSFKRHEFEKTITKEDYDTLFELKKSTVIKQRLIKEFRGKKIEFDYFPKYSLITAEIEFENEDDAEKFRTNMKEVTGVDKYKNQILAK